jgi:hypothetical protein
MLLSALATRNDKQGTGEDIHHYRGYHFTTACNSFHISLGRSYRYTTQ